MYVSSYSLSILNFRSTQDVVAVLVGNKSDLRKEREVTEEEIKVCNLPSIP